MQGQGMGREASPESQDVLHRRVGTILHLVGGEKWGDFRKTLISCPQPVLVPVTSRALAGEEVP